MKTKIRLDALQNQTLPFESVEKHPVTGAALVALVFGYSIAVWIAG